MYLIRILRSLYSVEGGISIENVKQRLIDKKPLPLDQIFRYSIGIDPNTRKPFVKIKSRNDLKNRIGFYKITLKDGIMNFQKFPYSQFLSSPKDFDFSIKEEDITENITSLTLIYGRDIFKDFPIL